MHDATLTLPRRALWLGALFAAELVAIVLAFQVLASVESIQAKGRRYTKVRKFQRKLQLLDLTFVLRGSP